AWHRPVDLAGRQALSRRQAVAAATLLWLKGPGQVWPLFRHSQDPTLRGWLVWKAGELGCDPRPLITRLDGEKAASARRALIVALGEFAESRLPADVRAPVVKKLLSWYRDDPDPGVHAAISWLLRNKGEGSTPRLLDWGQAEALAKIDGELAGKKARVKPASLPSPLGGRGAGGEGDSGGGWYVNGQGQTVGMIQGPVEFRMGSPRWEPDRSEENETRHVRHVGRSYAIAATSVTVGQWRRFLAERPKIRSAHVRRGNPDVSSPATSLTYYEALE